MAWRPVPAAVARGRGTLALELHASSVASTFAADYGAAVEGSAAVAFATGICTSKNCRSAGTLSTSTGPCAPACPSSTEIRPRHVWDAPHVRERFASAVGRPCLACANTATGASSRMVRKKIAIRLIVLIVLLESDWRGTPGAACTRNVTIQAPRHAFGTGPNGGTRCRARRQR